MMLSLYVTLGVFMLAIGKPQSDRFYSMVELGSRRSYGHIGVAGR
jgi:hypothetical protein